MKASSSTSSSNRGIGAVSALRRATLFVLGTAILVLGIGWLFATAYGERYGPGITTDPGVPANTGIVIVGSSQAQQGYNPLVIEDRTGILTYNLGSVGEKPDSTYYLLRDFLADHRPETVILDIYWRTLEGTIDFSQLARTMGKIRSETIRRRFFREAFPFPQKIEYTVPLLRYRQDFFGSLEHGLNVLLGRGAAAKTEAEPVEAAQEVDYHGHRHTDRVVSGAALARENKFRYQRFSGFSTRQLAYLSRIVELCRLNEIDIYAVAAPILPDSLAFIEEYDDISAELTAFFEGQGIPFLDFNVINRREGFVDQKHFGDENHLNGAGADIFTSRLLEELPK